MQIDDRDEAKGGIMTPEHRAQMRRLARFRESVRIARERAAAQDAATTTPPEMRELVQAQRNETTAAGGEGNSRRDGDGNGNENGEISDPLIYPGLYAPSGFDILSILIRVRLRPDPKIDLGLIDSSCALILCDLLRPDTPIVYCSEPFEVLTGYKSDEILGNNCRFLQSPDGIVERGVRRRHTDDRTVFELKTRISAKEETQTTILNYKKGGESFDNILTTIPIRWDTDDVRFIVGFQVDRRNCFLGPVRA